jgi:hypothetical protein
MKKKILILILFTTCYILNAEIIICNPLSDTTSAKYIPLAVGNVYKYHYSSSGGFNYDYKMRITNDTIIGSKKYFIMVGYHSGTYRYDSLTGNLYIRSGSGYCSYSPFEIILDSLASRKGDTIKNCKTANYNKRLCTDTSNFTLFGISVKRKVFAQYGWESNEGVTYARGFGISSYDSWDIWGMSSEFLVGCYVNGLLYGDTTLTEVTNLNTEIPDKFALYQNYPNPFNPITKIKFDIATHSVGQTFLSVYDIQGREIQTLVNEPLQPGTYEVTFNGSNFASGVYFYQLRTGEFVNTKKLILIK